MTKTTRMHRRLRSVAPVAALGVLLACSFAAAPRAEAPERLGDYLRAARKATGLTLRGVEARTGITNGYLSQIEGNTVERPSPNVLFKLAEAYGTDYADLLIKAGHRVPNSAADPNRPTKLAGIPLRALEELTDDEAAELRNYLAYIRQKRGS